MAFQTFTGWQYLLIDVANQYGLDKDEFEPRIEWAEQNLNQLEQLGHARTGKWKERPLYFKAVQAIRKAQQGQPTGHMIGFDAVCSGMQIMSATTGCHSGADATGLVDPNRRADAYTQCTDTMRIWVPHLPDNERSKVKPAVMTVLYGSREQPKLIFGEDTPELNAFYKAMWKMAPGACELLQDLLESWQAYALSHDWVLPDNYHAHVKVMDVVEKRIEVDELDHATFTYRYKENVGQEKGLSNVANVVHSIDAYVLRSLIRRCNYDRHLMEWASQAIEIILLERATGESQQKQFRATTKELVAVLKGRYDASKMVDIRILDEATFADLEALDSDHLRALAKVVNDCLSHKPFPVIAVHDEFKCHANNMNRLRYHYKEIMADLADSEILSDIFSQLLGKKVTYVKKSNNLSEKIRQSNYGLC